MNHKITELYDALTYAEGFFGWRRPQPTVHKRLDFSKLTSLQTYKGYDINHLIQALPLGLNAESKILDAGCGHGGTLAQLIEAYGCQGIGISLSAAQIETARTLFPSPRATFLVSSYDDPPTGPFDLIITIEALIHSPSLTQSYQALSSRLSDNGYLLIVEDMFIQPPKESVDGDTTNDSNFSPNRLQQLWCLGKLYTDEEHLAAARKANLQLCTNTELHATDLSECVISRDTQKLRRAMLASSSIARLLPQSRLKTALKAAIGGYILEYFYAKGLANYKLMVFECDPSRA